MYHYWDQGLVLEEALCFPKIPYLTQENGMLQVEPGTCYYFAVNHGRAAWMQTDIRGSHI